MKIRKYVLSLLACLLAISFALASSGKLQDLGGFRQGACSTMIFNIPEACGEQTGTLCLVSGGKVYFTSTNCINDINPLRRQ